MNEGEEEYMEKFMGSCDPHGGDMKLGEPVHASTREYMGRGSDRRSMSKRGEEA